MNPSASLPPAPRSLAQGPAIDPVALGKLRELDPDGHSGIVLRVLRTYDGALASGLAALAQAAEKRHAVDVRRLTHTLKSSSASVGALGFSALCGDAERLARDGWQNELLPLLAELQAEGRRVQMALQRMLPDIA